MKYHAGCLKSIRKSNFVAVSSIVQSVSQGLIVALVLYLGWAEKDPLLSVSFAMWISFALKVAVILASFFIQYYPNLQSMSVRYQKVVDSETGQDSISNDKIEEIEDDNANENQIDLKFERTSSKLNNNTPITLCSLLTFLLPLVLVRLSQTASRMLLNIVLAGATDISTTTNLIGNTNSTSTKQVLRTLFDVATNRTNIGPKLESQAVTAVATISIVYPLGHLHYGWLNECKALASAFRSKGNGNDSEVSSTPQNLASFIFIAFLISITWGLAFNYTSASAWVMRHVINAPENIIENARLPLKIFTFLSIAVSIRVYFSGLLIARKQTKLLILSGPIRLLTILTVAWTLLRARETQALTSDFYQPATIGIFALVCGFFAEACAVSFCYFKFSKANSIIVDKGDKQGYELINIEHKK
eukprot:g1333.t1